MENILLWIIENKEWLFSGIGIFVLNIFSFFWGKKVGINITGNKIINNYNLYDNKEIAYDSGVQLSCGASGVEYIVPHDSLLVLKATNCDLYVENILIKTLKDETYSYLLSRNQKVKLIYSNKQPQITIYPTKKVVNNMICNS